MDWRAKFLLSVGALGFFSLPSHPEWLWATHPASYGMCIGSSFFIGQMVRE